MQSIRELIETSASKYGDKIFLNYNNESISFNLLNQHINKTANAFIKEKIGKKDRVAIMLMNRPEYLYVWFGLNKIGASMVPINTEFTAYETEYIIQHSESKIVVTDMAHYDIVTKAVKNSGISMKIILLDSNECLHGAYLFNDFIDQSAAALPEIDIESDDEAAILYTSGTTGRPKGCIVDQYYYFNIGRMYVREYSVKETDRILTPLPLFHMNAQSLSTIGALLSGARLILIDRFHPSTWWKTIREAETTIFHYLGVIPAMLWSLPESKYDLSPNKIYGVGAGVPKDIHEKFEKRFNVELLEVYGSTESGGGGAFLTGRNVGKRKVSCSSFGKVLPEVEAIIADENDQELPYEEVGELLIRSSNNNDRRKGFMKGYLKDEEATEEAWRNGWFHTGDFCKRDEEGYFYFVDRKKDIIRRSGENISASEVEAVIRLHPMIIDTAVIPVPDKKRIEEVKAYIIKRKDAEVSPQEIIEWCEERLAYFKIPRYVEFREDFPRTSTQKVKKNILKQETDDLTISSWDRTEHMMLKREKKRLK